MSESAIIDVWATSMSLNMFAHNCLISKIVLVNLMPVFFIIVLFFALALVINLFDFLGLLGLAKIRLIVLSSVKHQFFLTVGICTSFKLTFPILLKPFAQHSLVVGRLCAGGNLGFLG